MPRTPEILWTCIVIDTFDGGDRTLYGRDARGGVDMVDGDSESSAVIVGVFSHHLVELQLVSKLPVHRHADKTLAVGGHEVHIFNRSKLCCTYQVSLILPVRVVNDDNHLTITEII